MGTTANQGPPSAASAAPAACELCGQPLAGVEVLARYGRNVTQRHAALRADVRRELSAEYASREREQASARQEAAEAAVERRWERRLRQMESTNRGLRDQLEGYKRRLEGLSPGSRGRFTEEDLLTTLRAEFPFDRFELVRSGPARRPDIIQTVRHTSGSVVKNAGDILYECKDRIRWENEFVAQARAARERHHATYAVVVTRSFPAGRQGFVVADDVLVVDADGVLEIGRVLRNSMLQLAQLHLDDTERGVRGAALLRYLRSDDFIVSFGALRTATKDARKALEQERGWHDRAWAKRDGCYRRIESNTAAIDEGIGRALNDAAAVGAEAATALAVVPTISADTSRLVPDAVAS